MATLLQTVLASGRFVTEETQNRWPGPYADLNRGQDKGRLGDVGCCGLFGVDAEAYFNARRRSYAFGGPLPGDSDYVAPMTTRPTSATVTDTGASAPGPVLTPESNAVPAVAIGAVVLAAIAAYFMVR